MNKVLLSTLFLVITPAAIAAGTGSKQKPPERADSEENGSTVPAPPIRTEDMTDAEYQKLVDEYLKLLEDLDD